MFKELPALQEGHPLHLCHHTMVRTDSCENRGNSFHHGWVMFNSVWGANMEYDSVLNYGGGYAIAIRDLGCAAKDLSPHGPPSFIGKGAGVRNEC